MKSLLKMKKHITTKTAIILVLAICAAATSCKKTDAELKQEIERETRIRGEVEQEITAEKRNKELQTTCALNIRNVHQAIRAHENLKGLDPSDTINITEIIGQGKYMDFMPACPSGGTYTLQTKYPPIGQAAMRCSIHDHNPGDTSGW